MAERAAGPAAGLVEAAAAAGGQRCYSGSNGDARPAARSPGDTDPVIYFVRKASPSAADGDGAGLLELGAPEPVYPSLSPPAGPSTNKMLDIKQRECLMEIPCRLSGKRGTDPKDPIAIERLNLMNMAKLSIKGLIESALNLGRSLDSDYAPLQQFFVVMEHCLKHGLKAKKTFLGQNKSFWGALELVEKLCPEAGEITVSVKDLPGLKTAVGRGRAWLRLALMQKKLSDYMKALINRKDLLSEFYEPNALMMEEEGAVIAGLLVGLNVIDVNLCMKGEDLDTQVGVIDFSLYLKDGGHSSKTTEGDGQITAILDQKNYVEELNRHLSSTVNNLQAKVDALEKSNTKLTEELAVANNRIITLQEDAERVKEENAFQLECTWKKMEVSKADGSVEVPVQRAGRHCGEEGDMETRRQLKEETQLRLDVEKELEVQIGMKQEMEMALKMLEKDICDKQDVLVTFRQQVDEVQALNHELCQKAQGSDHVIRQKNEIIARLEEKASQMSCTVRQLEQRLHREQESRRSAEMDNRLFKQDFGEKIVGLEGEVDLLKRQRAELHACLKRQRAGGQPGCPGDGGSETRAGSGPPQTTDIRREAEEVRKENHRLCQAKEARVPNGSHTRRRSNSGTETETEPDDFVQTREEDVICKLCHEAASLTKPKRQCSNCGGIFCAGCAANTLPLPSSLQPVCVCNTCHVALLEQYAPPP